MVDFLSLCLLLVFKIAEGGGEGSEAASFYIMSLSLKVASEACCLPDEHAADRAQKI